MKQRPTHDLGNVEELGCILFEHGRRISPLSHVVSHILWQGEGFWLTMNVDQKGVIKRKLEYGGSAHALQTSREENVLLI